MNKHECKKCDYKWFARVEKPKQCPNCKRQIKYEISKNSSEKNAREVEKK